jgi:hypothetical protein
MAAECAGLFSRLGLQPEKTIAVFSGACGTITKIVEKRRGSREAFKDYVTDLLIGYGCARPYVFMSGQKSREPFVLF